MSQSPTEVRKRITIAILALGGQGGGVLADWIIETAKLNGYKAQSTSVPGVAQRTGSTVYYVELLPKVEGDNRSDPVMALSPVPGDIDIVIASELMEAGRAILRGFVSKDRTTLIGSTHRIYAIAEKAAMADATRSSERILEAAHQRAKKFIGFDMEKASSETGSIISSIMFGALANSGALPFPKETFEEAIKAGGKAVPLNLAGLEAGAAGALSSFELEEVPLTHPVPTSDGGWDLTSQIDHFLDRSACHYAYEGARRLMEYQDQDYAQLYVDRLRKVAQLDNGFDDHALSRETARFLALWMAYEDTVRVADLKIRISRAERIKQEVRKRDDQVLRVTEYMHPRLQEVCETLPAWLGKAILSSPMLSKLGDRFFAKGRHVETTSLGWYLALRCTAGLRRFRRSSLRYQLENERIEEWLAKVVAIAPTNIELAVETVRNQQLIKGYSETYERGLNNYNRVMAAIENAETDANAAARVRTLREAALADETGCKLDEALAI